MTLSNPVRSAAWRRVAPERSRHTALTSRLIVVVAVYGDLLKRVMQPSVALILLYIAAVFLLMRMRLNGRTCQYAKPPVISRLVLILVWIYTLQLLTTFDIDLFPAISMYGYVVIPLLFIVTITRSYVDFDLITLARDVAMFMLPIHLVGAVQYFIEPNFLVSTAYSERGGIIERNFLDGLKTFERYPSLFASADRYAGVSAVQFLLSSVLFGDYQRKSKNLAWAVMCLGCAVLGLLVAGARSRILIAGLAASAGGLAVLVLMMRSYLTPRAYSLLGRAGLLFVSFLAISLAFEEGRARLADLPILTMLSQTAESGDAGKRFDQGLEVNGMPYDVTFFGSGLGTEANGRPGEFAIRAMWIEGGFFWTALMLLVNAAILVAFLTDSVRAVVGGEVSRSVLFVGGGLYWLFGLLAGLSSTYELSLALLLFPSFSVAFTSGNPAFGRSQAKKM